MLKKTFALTLALLTLATSVGIKLYFHECLTCHVTDFSFIDEVSACHQHHLIHHINHDHKSNIYHSIQNDDDCCVATEAYIQYHYNNTLERILELSSHSYLVLELVFYINALDINRHIVLESFNHYFINPPPLLNSGVDILKSIHQLKFDCYCLA